MTGVFVLSLIKKDNSIVDTAYGIGFILLAISTNILSDTRYLGADLVSIIAIIWAIRLSTRIYFRNKGKPEDFRYKNWRETWTHFKTRSFFQIYMLQGSIILLIASPIIFLNSFSFVPIEGAWNIFVVVGLLVWITGFVFEAVGDYQLDKFIQKNQLKKKNNEPVEKSIMDEGLWSLTRHPNYFGETTLWWGVWIISLSIASTHPLVLLTILSPITITFLLLKISGIPMLEKKYDNDPEFQEYKKKTNAFFPSLSKRKN